MRTAEIQQIPRLWPDAKRGPWNLITSWTFVNGRMECVGVELRSYVADPEGVDVDFAAAQKRSKSGPRAVTATTWRQVPIASIMSDEREQTVGWLAANDEQGAEQWGGLAEVANVYTAAWHAGQPPTKSVAEHFDITSSAAAKRVARARDAGLLPPTRAGLAEGARVPSDPPPGTKSTTKRGTKR